MQFIESRANARYKQASRWVHQPRTLRKLEMAVAEGLHPLHELLNWPLLKIKEVWVAEALLNHSEWITLAEQLSMHDGCDVFSVSDAMYWQLSELASGAGPLVFFEVPSAAPLPDQACDVLVLDAVQDPGNVGTLIRTAAAAGLSELWYTEGAAYPWSSKVLRAGMGGHRLVQLRKVQADNLPGWVKDMPVCVTALDNARSIYTLDLKPPTVWVVGSEGAGVSEAWNALATHRVFIPHSPSVESLNVGVACGVCLFEQYRQRLI